MNSRTKTDRPDAARTVSRRVAESGLGRARVAPAKHRGAHEVRIVGGVWKRSKLPVADVPGLRPTPDRVRETLFNWLGQDLSGWRCLDAFAGTGALGFEAASRGAAEVVMLENQRSLVSALQIAKQRLAAQAVQVIAADALAWMQAAVPGRFELVLLDPPFAAQVFDAALQAARALLSPGGCVYLEADQAYDAPRLAELGFDLYRQGRAGQVHYHLMRPSSRAASAAAPAP